MAIYYIGDMHFFHGNALNFDNRPFDSFADELEKMTVLWNNTVKDTDEVKILGDMFCSEPLGLDYKKILNSLNGDKTLIVGNHDDRLLQAGVEDCFKSIVTSDYFTDIVYKENGPIPVEVHASHYPYLIWNKGRKHSYHVYAHVHNLINEDTIFLASKERALNAGCMITGYKPVTLTNLIEYNKVYKTLLLQGKTVSEMRNY